MLKISLREIADQFDLELIGDASIEVSGIASLVDAVPGELAFLFQSSYKNQLKTSNASAIVAREADSVDCNVPVLISTQPRLAWAKIAALFDPAPRPTASIHETAVISEHSTIGSGISIGPYAVIEDGVSLSDGVCVGAGCFVGERVSIGEGTRLHANVTIYHDVQLGRDCIVHSAVVLGADGFGFEFDKDTASLVKIPQVFSVHIGNNVEIGAGSTIDRGALNHTSIGDGVKIDNQVQVGHGTSIGIHTAISGCTAIAGSTQIGSYCLIGGGVGIIDNIEIVDQVEITAMSLVSQSIKEKGRYSSGTGLMPGGDWKRSIVGFRKLPELIRRLRKLEKNAN
ncbi:MAG: UDP-3-O-(3-hydroxymyristoyl)glucosamine N-acyltransferase [Gammaproteobacteria bacterium]|nr:UDP-3-O-(3-hydroxymyristoyl)glucosamine N-acyltransferase [Gammaproteobacteria bacterium]